ncbi:MAG TPA: threonylcarbamoyl-AMP synthase, partial [Clostridia bacterium]|nr:threonylcarbamoyl-AMP synthase [Clostridia bacterium]
LARLVGRARAGGKRVGLLLTTETAGEYCRQKIQPDYLEVLGSRGNPRQIAACLFDALRNCDRHHLDLVYAESIPEKDIGLAVMNRLLKAAGYRVIRV